MVAGFNIDSDRNNNSSSDNSMGSTGDEMKHGIYTRRDSTYIFRFGWTSPALTIANQITSKFFSRVFLCHFTQSIANTVKQFTTSLSSNIEIPSLYNCRKLLQQFFPIKPDSYDICINGCSLFVDSGLYCVECGAKRYKITSASTEAVKQSKLTEVAANAGHIESMSLEKLANATLNAPTSTAKLAVRERSDKAVESAEASTATADRAQVTTPRLQMKTLSISSQIGLLLYH